MPHQYRHRDPLTGRDIVLEFTDEVRRLLQVHGLKDCEHEFETRRRKVKGGAIQFTPQCMFCGHAKQAIKRPANADEIGDFQPDLAARYRDQLAIELSEKLKKIAFKQSEKLKEMRAQYGAYLKSDSWKKRRKLVLERANNICEGCGLEPATDVHHLTYDHIGNEFLFELVAICRACHERIHIGDEDDDNGSEFDL